MLSQKAHANIAEGWSGEARGEGREEGQEVTIVTTPHKYNAAIRPQL
jgi:hypothetical protein